MEVYLHFSTWKCNNLGIFFWEGGTLSLRSVFRSKKVNKPSILCFLVFFNFVFSNYTKARQVFFFFQIHFNLIIVVNLILEKAWKKENIMSIKQCIRVLSKPNLISQKCSASSSTLFGHCFNTNLAGIVPTVSVLHNQHQYFSTTSYCPKYWSSPNKQAKLQIRENRLRIRDIPVDVAKLYMESEAYKLSYGDFKVIVI